MTAWQDQPLHGESAQDNSAAQDKSAAQGESAQGEQRSQGQQPQSRRQLRLKEQRAGAHDEGAQMPQQGTDPVFPSSASTGPTPTHSAPTHSVPTHSAPINTAPEDPASTGSPSTGPSPVDSQPAASHDGRHGLRTREIVDTQDVRLDVAESPDPQIETFARPGWDAPARRSDADASGPATQQPRSRAEAAIASGRRSQHSFPQAEPQTQDTPEVPASDDRPVYRIRDFRPESRRSAFSSTSELSPSDWNRPGASGEPGNLDYYTQQGPGLSSASEAEGAEAEPTAPEASDTASKEAATDPASTDSASIHTEPDEAETSDRAQTDHAAGEHAAYPSLIASPPVTAPVSAPQLVVPPVAVPPVVVPPATPVPDTHSFADLRAADQESRRPHDEHTLTRRELRAMRDSTAPAATTESAAITESAAEPQAPQAVADEQASQVPHPLQAPATPAPQSSHELSSALAEFDALMGRGPSDTPAPFRLAAEAPTVAAEPSTAEPSAAEPSTSEVSAAESRAAESTVPELNAPEPSTPELSAPWSVSPELFAAPQDAGQPVSAASAGGSENTGLQNPVVENPAVENPSLESPTLDSSVPDASTADPVAEATAPSATADGVSTEASRPFTVPTGHWSTQAAAADETDGVTLSRNIGVTSGSVTSNHLVISAVPNAKDLLLPFSPTGEIMVTGTIDLPRSFGTTGAHPARYDHSDVDALLEAGDREDSNVDSAPVRAIRAVSTHTSSRGLIGTAKPPRSSRLPMVLAVSTAALATVVVVLFVAGFVLHLF